jgi:tetratricopeptide (TPR) repeat protein
MSVKFLYHSLFLATGFLLLFCAFVGKAQNNSAVNLAGTAWDTNQFPRQKSNEDSSVTITTYILGFYAQGKVKAGIIKDKPYGKIQIDDYEYVDDNVYDARTGQRERKTVSKGITKEVKTPRNFSQEIWEGTYAVKGKSVYLNFPTFTINAIVTATSIEGILTQKDTNKEEPVLFTRTAITNNSSDSKKSMDSNDVALSNKSVGKDKRQTAETLSTKAIDLFSQKKYREAIDVLNTIIEIELDTKENLIRAYVFRAASKLSLQDYQGAIKDCNSAIQISTPLKNYYDEQNKKKAMAKTPSTESSSKNPFEAALRARLIEEDPEESAANYGLNMGYYFRAIAKSKLGDKAGACEDSRIGSKINGSIRKEPNEFCN